MYLIAALPLLFTLFFLPGVKPGGSRGDQGSGIKITPACWAWVAAMLAAYISAQAYPVFLSFLLEEKHLGTASNSALGMVFFAG